MNDTIARQHVAASALAELVKRHGVAIPLIEARALAFKIADSLLEIPEQKPQSKPAALADFNQAIVVLEQEVDETLQKLNSGTTDRPFWSRRLDSCQEALRFLNRHNLPLKV